MAKKEKVYNITFKLIDVPTGKQKYALKTQIKSAIKAAVADELGLTLDSLKIDQV